jgi:hypothetical protein
LLTYEQNTRHRPSLVAAPASPQQPRPTRLPAYKSGVYLLTAQFPVCSASAVQGRDGRDRRGGRSRGAANIASCRSCSDASGLVAREQAWPPRGVLLFAIS